MAFKGLLDMGIYKRHKKGVDWNLLAMWRSMWNNKSNTSRYSKENPCPNSSSNWTDVTVVIPGAADQNYLQSKLQNQYLLDLSKLFWTGTNVLFCVCTSPKCSEWLQTNLDLGNVIKMIRSTGSDRECVSTGAAGARTRRSLGHHLLHPLILRLLVLCAPADFEAQISLL